MHNNALLLINNLEVKDIPEEEKTTFQKIIDLPVDSNNIFYKSSVSLAKLKMDKFIYNVINKTEEIMDVYCADDEEYATEFYDLTEELMGDYNNEKLIDCIVYPSGKIDRIYSYLGISPNRGFFVQDNQIYERRSYMINGKRYTKSFRSKLAKKMRYVTLPLNKIYKSFDKYANSMYNKYGDRYGYYFNPNTMYDWYEIGGRWPDTFLVKDSVQEGMLFNVFDEKINSLKTPEGYHWVSCARKKDIEWDMMHEIIINHDKDAYNRYKEFLKNDCIPEEYSFYGRLKINESKDAIVYANSIIYKDGDTFDQYMQRKYSTSKLETDNNHYYCNFTEIFMDNDIEYFDNADEFEKIINDKCNDDTVFVSIDYHI